MVVNSNFQELHIPTLVNGPEIVSSSSGKAELFARNFASGSSLNDAGHKLCDFPNQTDASIISNLTISPKTVAKIIFSLESSI